MCFCLNTSGNRDDSSIYLIGTPEGLIHKCSMFSGQLETYRKHSCAVTCVTFSPFSPDVFLSCSSDWTIHIWKLDQPEPVLSLSSSRTPVWDVRWSPMCPSVFGAVTETQLEIWDLNVNMMDPVIVQPAAPGVRMTSLLFAPQTDCVLVGDTEGNVTVYKLHNLNAGGRSQVDVLKELLHTEAPK
uniref:Dynein axonemal intermediate chain 4 n=1 Tax=Salarias fasciatus TaxID=181472 RepID=A0A672HFB5_SALFA